MITRNQLVDRTLQIANTCERTLRIIQGNQEALREAGVSGTVELERTLKSIESRCRKKRREWMDRE